MRVEVEWVGVYLVKGMGTEMLDYDELTGIDVKRSYLSFSPTPQARRQQRPYRARTVLNQYAPHVQKTCQIRTNPSSSLLAPRLPQQQQQQQQQQRRTATVAATTMTH